MTIISFPAFALYIGSAIDPQNPSAGLTKAVAIAGEERVRSVAETLSTYNGCTVNQVLTTLAGTWYTCAPMVPAIDCLRELGPAAAMKALAAHLFAHAADGFNIDALAALSPGVRALAGLPTASEIEEAQRTAMLVLANHVKGD